MPMAPIDRQPYDRQLWEEQLESFVPSRVFDAHCHHKRISWVSDGVDAAVFCRQGAAMCRAWAELMADKINLKFTHTDGQPVIYVYEQLLAIQHAAGIAALSRNDMEDIWRIASREFGLAEEARN